MIRAYDDYGNVVDLVEYEEQIRADERRKVLHEQRALDVNMRISAEEIRSDERAKFAEWLKKSEKYSLYEVVYLDDGRYNFKIDIDEVLAEYEKQMTGGTEE